MLGKIAWKNIIRKPLNSALCICLLLFGVGIISLLLLIQDQLEQKFSNDLKNIDLVVGAKGSPLQLVLSAVYHLDAPTGNVKLAEAKEIMNKPLVKVAIPLAYGDSYKGYRILGTTDSYLSKYEAKLREGRIFTEAMEAVIGSDVAARTGLKMGDVFLGTHGEVQEGHVHDDHPYTVVGILEKSNSVLDQLLLSNIESVWQVHSHHEEHTSHVDSLHATTLDFDHDHENHDHEHDHNHDHDDHVITADSMEITAILIECKTKMAVLTMPRIINEQTNMQAVLPALEINRLFHMIGIGATTMKLVAGGIMFMAGFSVFFVLYNRLRERKHELALMRSLGYRPRDLFLLLLLEGLIMSAMGFILGWLLSRLGLFFLNKDAQHDFNFQFDLGWVSQETWLLILTLVLGMLAALIPAIRAMKMEVSETLTK
ncbi:MAG: ABC transporter permease [Bacteroidota bacterium]